MEARSLGYAGQRCKHNTAPAVIFYLEVSMGFAFRPALVAISFSSSLAVSSPIHLVLN
jgi:hypothetical protein